MSGAPSESSIALAFIERYVEDSMRGDRFDVGHYQRLFPGHEELIHREYARVAEADGGADHRESHVRTRSSDRPRAAPPASGDLSEAPGDELFPKEQVGRYRLLRTLGRGAQGIVYLAEDTRLHRKVAVKVLTTGAGTSEEAMRRFQREAAVASKLAHPGICGVYDAGRADGVSYIAMQLVSGETLAQRIAKAKKTDGKSPFNLAVLGPGSETEPPSEKRSNRDTSSVPTRRAEIMDILRVVAKVARALDAAHEAGVVHRDIKPGNVMITSDGQPVILDFGLARDDADVLTVTRSGDLFGTPAYMSPEQLMAHRIPVDGRTDVYSLGVSLFEALTLRRPFEAPTRDALYHAILANNPPDIRDLDPVIPRDLAVVLTTALEKDRERRYQSALELALDLERIQNTEPIKARPAGPMVRLHRWAQRNRTVAASLTVVGATLAVGLVVSLVALARERDALAQEQRALVERDRAIDGFERMSDAALMDDLVRIERELWPRHPRHVPKMQAWLRWAARLLSRRQRHASDLATLRASALPLTAAEEAAQEKARRRVHADLYRLRDEIRYHIGDLEHRAGRAVTARRREVFEDQIDQLRDRLEEIDRHPGLRDRLQWSFERPEDLWRFRVLSKLVEDIGALPPLIASMEKRLRFSASLHAETVAAHRATWYRCRREVELSPRYGGLRLEDQVGLVPLGMDAASGLWEFWVFGSGRKPSWEPSSARPLSGRVRLDETSGIVLVLIPAGSFEMGDASDPRRPRHAVTLSPFFISKYELTQHQWRHVMGSNPSEYQAGRYFRGETVTHRNPVEQVSWTDCEGFLERIGLVFPTEAQWELACRGGTTTRFSTGDATASLAGYANIADAASRASYPAGWPAEPGFEDAYAVHAPVGSMRPNAFGLHDVHGNVWEWCRDPQSPYSVPVRSGDAFRLVATTSRRVTRGGSFNDPAAQAESGNRNGQIPAYRALSLGCRPARPIDR